MADRIRVLIADDHVVVRLGVSAALSLEGDIEIVGEASDGAEAVSLAKSLKPDVVVMDLMMPKMDGAAATAALVGLPEAPKVLILTSFDLAPKVRLALEAGAIGAIVKTSTPEQIAAAIRAAAAGRHTVSPSIAHSLAKAAVRPRLSSRQVEILSLVARGCTNEDIARMLGIGPNGVKDHLTRAYRELNAASRTEAVTLARELGLVD